MHPDDRSTTPVWLGLGSNLGDRRSILDRAVALLSEADGVTLEVVSRYHETLPVGGPPGQGAFLNAAARVRTTLDPFGLLAVCQEVENQLGRVRAVRWGERTLDVDLLIFGAKFVDAPNLKLPHPRLAFRRFVLGPLAEIAPSITDTMTKRTIADLLANLDRRPRFLAIDGAEGPIKARVFRRLVDELPAFGINGGEPEPNEDLARGLIDHFEKKMVDIHVSRWASEPIMARWTVADYVLDEGPVHSSIIQSWETVPGADLVARKRAYFTWVKRFRMELADSLPPTFVLVLPGSSWSDRRPGQSRVPILRPDSDDPDAIVAEVLATCRSIEGV